MVFVTVFTDKGILFRFIKERRGILMMIRVRDAVRILA
jgi:hypothetical protein